MRRRNCKFLFLALFFYGPTAQANPLKIIGIHSYEADFPWTHIVTDSFENQLRGRPMKNLQKAAKPVEYSLQNFYLEVKKYPVSEFGSPASKIEAVKNYVNNHQVDYALMTDDFALQTLGKWISEKNIPIVFLGLNGEVPEDLERMEKHRYSGVLERYYVAPTVKLMSRFLKKNRLRVLFMLEGSETSDAVKVFIDKAMKTLPEHTYSIFMTNEWDQWKKTLQDPETMKNFDAVVPFQHFSLQDSQKGHVQAQDVVTWIYQNAKLPMALGAPWQMKCGALLSISNLPEAQGYYAGTLLRKGLKGEFPPPESPPQGDIELNTFVAKKYNLEIPLDVLSVAKLTRTVEVPCKPVKF